MKNISGTLYQYMQSVQAYISPPIAAVFLLGITWKRLNGAGAITSLLTGFVLGMGRLVLELVKPSLPAGPLYAYADMNFLHFAVVLFVICSAVLIGVSLATAPPARERMDGLTFETSQAERTVPWYRRTIVWLSLLLVACVGATWLYFTG
jgi:SSS family solute:Na+ symporter